MEKDANELAAEVRKYLAESYDVPAHRINEAVDRHAFRVEEGARYNRPADEVGDEIAGVERWVMKGA